LDQPNEQPGRLGSAFPCEQAMKFDAGSRRNRLIQLRDM
jgi:hypothetical protein